MAKKRLDIVMAERGLAPSRQRAQAMIMAGIVTVDGRAGVKPGDGVSDDARIKVRQDDCPFVGRGGFKLQKAIDVFGIELSGRICADIGASTGGFTDCMLQHGAQRVYAVEVGYGQLDARLRGDERVVVMERTNARFLDDSSFDPQPDFASIDVSFISLKLILPALKLAGVREISALIKPQFEAGREHVGKHGVVRDADIHRQVIENILGFADETEYTPVGLSYSPIKGPKGNIEFLAHLMRGAAAAEISAAEVVAEAHAQLDK